MATITSHRGIAQDAPQTIKLQVLAAGFDLAFLVTFILGIIILILAVVARPKVHPDYLSGDRNEEMMTGLI
jgi:uncharacterized membrane protein